jgi:nucleoside 2-deoxyribosyltransferase
MRFYLASGFQNKELVQKVSGILSEQGYYHTYDWTSNDRVDTFSKLQAIGEAEKIGVQTADVLIALLPGGKGTHIEIGMAIGFNKPVYIFSESPISDPVLSCTFYHIEGVTIISGTLEGFLQEVIDDLKNRK